MVGTFGCLFSCSARRESVKLSLPSFSCCVCRHHVEVLPLANCSSWQGWRWLSCEWERGMRAGPRWRYSFSTGRGRERFGLASRRRERRSLELKAEVGTVDSQSAAECVGSMTPFALTRSVLKASRDRQLDLRLWKAFACRAEQLAPSFAAEELTRVLACFSSEGFRHKGLLSAASKTLLPQLPQLSPSAVCRLAQVYGQLLCVDEQLLPVLRRETARKASAMTCREVAYAFASLARLGQLEVPVQKCLSRELTIRHADLSPGAVVLSLQAAASLGLKDSRLIAALSAQLCRHVRSVSAKGLALAANALVRLKVQNRFVLTLVASAAEQEAPNLNGKDLAMLLHAIATSEGSYSSSCIRAIVDGVRRKACNFQVHELCVAAAALAKHFSSSLHRRRARLAASRSQLSSSTEANTQQADAEQEAEDSQTSLSIEEVHATCRKIAERAGQVSTQLAPRHVCSLVDAFSKVGFRYGPLFHHAIRHLEFTLQQRRSRERRRSEDTVEESPVYSINELAMLARAFRRLSIKSVEVLDHAATVLEEEVDALGGAVCTPHCKEPTSDCFPGGSEREVVVTAVSEAGQKETPRLYAFVWFLESAASESWRNEKGLNLFCNAISLRASELPSHAVVRVFEALQRLSLHPDTLVKNIQKEMQNSRPSLDFSEKQLSRVYAALLSLQLSPASFAIFAAPRGLLSEGPLRELKAAVERQKSREAHVALQRSAIWTSETDPFSSDGPLPQGKREPGGSLTFFYIPTEMQVLPGFDALKAVSEELERREMEARSLDFPASPST